jgi:hypothetical protein
MYEKLFASMVLPVRPEMAADSAVIKIEEIVADEAAGEVFFGGYAEDFLADIGLDVVESMPEAVAGKKIQG